MNQEITPALKECPQCLGAKEIMVPKETRGFEYKTCSLCKGEGEVAEELAEDFLLSLNEEQIEEYD